MKNRLFSRYYKLVSYKSMDLLSFLDCLNPFLRY